MPRRKLRRTAAFSPAIVGAQKHNSILLKNCSGGKFLTCAMNFMIISASLCAIDVFALSVSLFDAAKFIIGG